MRTSLIPNTPSRNKYTNLLLVLVVRLLAAPFLQGNWEIILSLLLLWAIILIVKTFYLYEKFFWFYLIVAAAAFLMETMARFVWLFDFQAAFAVSVYSVYAVYLSISVWLIMREIFLSQKVTLDTVFGGVSVYLLIGFIWSIFYGIVHSVDSNAFSKSVNPGELYSMLTYLSFTTLTTLGYGDVLPVNPFAMTLTNLEAIIGQMYPAIFIATIVGAYLSQKQNGQN